MSNTNRWIGSGNLTRDSEYKTVGSGYELLKFSIASNEYRKNGEDYVNFIDCELWGSRAASLGKYLEKGSGVIVEGRIRQDRWEKDGSNRSKLKIIVDNIEFKGSRRNGGGYDNGGQSQEKPTARPNDTGSHGGPEEFEDDIPF